MPLPVVSVIVPSEETSLPELLDPEPEESAESFGVVAQAATNKTNIAEIKIPDCSPWGSALNSAQQP